MLKEGSYFRYVFFSCRYGQKDSFFSKPFECLAVARVQFRVGVIKEMLEAEHLNPEIKASVEDAARWFERMGASVEEVSIPLIKVSGIFNGALGSARTALQWTYLMERPHEYDAATRRFSLLPALLPASLYQRALQLRSLMRSQVLDACERYDALLSASQATPPPRIEDSKRPVRSKEQALDQLRRFSYRLGASFAGVPAISVPCGFTPDGLPIGLQIMGKRFDEEAVLRAAHAFEQDTPWHTMRPPVGNE